MAKMSILRRSTVLVVIAVVAVAPALPAAATPDRSPNATTITDVSCDNGVELELGISTARAGHLPSGQLGGVATSVWLLDGPTGPPVFAFFETPGAGLDRVTTWCTWYEVAGEIWVGGDVILHPSLR